MMKDQARRYGMCFLEFHIFHTIAFVLKKYYYYRPVQNICLCTVRQEIFPKEGDVDWTKTRKYMFKKTLRHFITMKITFLQLLWRCQQTRCQNTINFVMFFCLVPKSFLVKSFFGEFELEWVVVLRWKVLDIKYDKHFSRLTCFWTNLGIGVT